MLVVITHCTIHLKQMNVGMGMTVFVDVWALFLAAMLRRWRRGGGGG